jgi:hypothetical protein
MHIGFIKDRKTLGYLCLKDIEAGNQVTVITWKVGIICIAITIAVNSHSSLFINDQVDLDLLEYNSGQVILVKDSCTPGELGKFRPVSKARGRANSNLHPPSSTVDPIIGQGLLDLPVTSVSVERLFKIRGGDSNIMGFLIHVWIWIMTQNYKTDGFQQKPKYLGHPGQNSRMAPKLLENRVNQNNPGQNCRSNPTLSMDTVANSLSPDYSEFQSKYYPELSAKRWDTNQYSIAKFKDLARDTRVDGIVYTRVSINEARAIAQAEVQKIVIHPTRAKQLEARRVDLDYKVQGPGSWTHVDIKTPVGSEALKK